MSVESRTLSDEILGLLDAWFPHDDVTLSQLRDQLHIASLPPGCDVFQRGAACHNYLVVVEGCVRVHCCVLVHIF